MSGSDSATVGGYTLLDRLGSGGMGMVYLARSASGRRVAVKLVHAQFAEDHEFRVRFRQEVSAARRVSGAFTAPVVDADPEAERPWMATLYVPGPTLAQRVAEGGPLAGAELTVLALGLTEALRDIHRVGVVHRDLKPANVLMAEDGPRVIDFGISRAADGQTLTATGRAFGTPPYMSPEQLASARDVGPASDVFALAAVVAFAASGRGPFDGASAHMTAYNVVHEAPVLDGVPEPLRTLVARCLDKDPGPRPTVEELLPLLQGLAMDGTAPAHDTLRAHEAPPTHETLHAHVAQPAHGTLPTLPTRVAPEPVAPVVDAGEPGRVGTAGPRRRLPSRRVLGSVSGGLVLALAALGAAVTYWPQGGDEGKAAGPNPSKSMPAPVLPDGWQPWQTTLRRPAPAGGSAESHSGCLVAGGPLYCGGEGFTAARVDAATGKAGWWFSASVESATPLTVRDATVVVNDAEGPDWAGDEQSRWVTGLNTRDASVRWTHSVGEGSTPTAFRDWVVVSSVDERSLIALNADDGEEAWRFSLPGGDSGCRLWGGDGALFAICRPLPKNGKDGARASLWDFDPATGRARRLNAISVTARPVGLDGGELVLMDWPFDHTGEPGAHPALTRVNRATGATRAVELELPEEFRVTGQDGIRLIDGTLYVARTNGVVTALSARTGKSQWRRDTGMDGLSAPVLSKKYGALYFVNDHGRVLALGKAAGKEMWRTSARAGTSPRGEEGPPRVYLQDDAVVALAGGVLFSVGPLGPGKSTGG